MKYQLMLFIFSLCSYFSLRAQTIINGPSCVLPAIEYQYLISTDDTTATGISICLGGGVYFGSHDSCLSDSLPPFILVAWNSGVDTASIFWSSPTGNTTTAISFSAPLQAGSIDTAYTFQTIAHDSSVSNIQCSPAMGGSCSPSYTYQWQQSLNNVDWNDIAGATNQNLDVNITLTETSYIRREVTETNSGTIGYSNFATINVTPQTTMQSFKRRQKFQQIVSKTKTTLQIKSGLDFTGISQKSLETL